MMNGYVVGVVSYLSGNMSATVRVAIASLTLLLATGMLLLATATLFTPRQCSELAERALIWLNTWLKRLARKVATRRLVCVVGGPLAAGGQGPAVNASARLSMRVGKTGCSVTIGFRKVKRTTGRSPKRAKMKL